MLDRLRRLIDRHLPSDPVQDDAGDAVELAVAVLLIEVLRADFQTGVAERAQVVESMGSVLGLDADARTALVETAEQQADDAHDLHRFTRRLNAAFTESQKLRLLEQLWRVARADSTVHKYEEHLIRRVADLLHVSHSGFITSKLRSEAPS